MAELTNDLLLQILDQQQQHGAALGNVAAKLDNLEATVVSQATVDVLDTRVGALEGAARRQWWVTVGVAPALALLHGIARKMGVDV